MRERNWIEIAVAVAALVVSGISLWIGVRTEIANEQMVAATTWPILMYGSSTSLPTPDGAEARMVVINGGVGPAKVETLAMFYHGKPMSTSAQFLKQCCGYDPSRQEVRVGAPTPNLLRAGEAQPFIGVAYTTADRGLAEKLARATNAVRFRACYCSVLNRCWLSNLKTFTPKGCSDARHRRCPIGGKHAPCAGNAA